MSAHEAGAAVTGMLAGAYVTEVRFQAMSWSVVLGRSEGGRWREFRITSDSDVSPDGQAFTDMERDAAGTMAALHGVVGCVVKAVEALGPMHYAIVFEDKVLEVREQDRIVDSAMIVSEVPTGVWVLCD